MPEIPIIGQTVGVPSFDAPANPFHAEPIESSAGEKLGEVGDQLQQIWQVQREHQNALNIADRSTTFDADLGIRKQDALNSGQGADDMVKSFQTNGSKLIDQYVSDPKNSSFAPQLSIALRQQFADEMKSFPSEATLRVARDLDYRAQRQVTQSVTAAASQFSGDRAPDGTAVFSTTSKGAAAVALARQQIDIMYPPQSKATENNFYHEQFEHQLTVAQGQQLAQDRPDLVQSYIKQANEGGHPLSADEQANLRNMATAAIEAPMKAVDANHEAVRATVINGLDSMQNTNDPRLANAALAAHRDGFLTDEGYRNYMHAAPPREEPPGDDHVFNQYAQQIKDDPTSLSSQDINAASDSLNTNQRRQLQAMRSDGLTALKKPIAGNYIQDRNAIRDALRPSSIGGPIAARQKERLDNALSDFESLFKSGQFDGPKGILEMHDARDQIIKSVKGEVGKVHVAPPIVAPSGPKLSPRETLRRVGAAARAAGYTPTVSPGGD